MHPFAVSDPRRDSFRGEDSGAQCAISQLSIRLDIPAITYGKTAVAKLKFATLRNGNLVLTVDLAALRRDRLHLNRMN